MATKRTSSQAFPESTTQQKMQKVDGDVCPLEFRSSKVFCHLRDADWTDATISCKGISWPVHRIKVAEKSVYFNDAFKEKSLFTEAASRNVNMADNERPASIERFLTYIYFPDTMPRINGQALTEQLRETLDDSVVWNLDALRLADYLMADGLRQFCMQQLNNLLKNAVDELHVPAVGTPYFRRMSLATFLHIGRDAGENGNERVQEAWVRIAACHWVALRFNKGFQGLIVQFPGLSAAILDLMHSNEKNVANFKRTSQSGTWSLITA